MRIAEPSIWKWTLVATLSVGALFNVVITKDIIDTPRGMTQKWVNSCEELSTMQATWHFIRGTV